MLAGLLALVVAAVFAGAASYVSFVEHPARMILDDRAALTEWKPSYRRGAGMQASLAAVGFVLGVIAVWQLGWQWLPGAILLIAGWPYTLLVIMPTNSALKAMEPAQAGAESRILLQQWGRLHAFRTVLGMAATAAFFWAAMRMA
jgi:hypothetical protein